jgi:hypothetical protein
MAKGLAKKYKLGSKAAAHLQKKGVPLAGMAGQFAASQGYGRCRGTSHRVTKYKVAKYCRRKRKNRRGSGLRLN